jgi:hypothetical protein
MAVVTANELKSGDARTAEIAREHLTDLLGGDWSRSPQFLRERQKFDNVLAQAVPEGVFLHDAEIAGHEIKTPARELIEEAAFGMACIAVGTILDRWYDSVVPQALRSAESRED